MHPWMKRDSEGVARGYDFPGSLSRGRISRYNTLLMSSSPRKVLREINFIAFFSVREKFEVKNLVPPFRRSYGGSTP